MTAQRLLAAEGAGLLVAGFGTAAVLLLRGQRQASRHMLDLQHQIDRVNGLCRSQENVLTRLLEAVGDEVSERRQARQRR
ncbi:hypothetical protein [Actinoallomurus acaciae]|uniref:Secreted protein n=1 Tax=Actinoallomurus acaciae TaxID=502577 RepID=A0ABV5YIC9_9ACTN